MSATSEQPKQQPLFTRQPCHVCGAKSGCRCHAKNFHAPRLLDPETTR